MRAHHHAHVLYGSDGADEGADAELHGGIAADQSTCSRRKR
jgi:hypothetical protein